jgi:serine/threonine protein kinase
MTAGDRLGPYQIIAPIGKGGMGEVYRARDTRLGREVAVKVSQERFGERFEREARVWADQVNRRFQDLSPDGKRAVILSPVETSATPTAEHEVVLIQNFLDELKRRLPLNGK